MSFRSWRWAGTSFALAALVGITLGPTENTRAQGPGPSYVSIAVTPSVAGKLYTDRSAAASLKTGTPIKHLVVIFQENVSFDHYFATGWVAGG